MSGPTLLEADWQQQVVDLATALGWTVTHHLLPRGTLAGWPDLTLLRPPEAIFVELKTEKGKLSVHQVARLGQLAACGLETHVWRPSDFEAVHARLRRSAAPQGAAHGLHAGV